MKFEGLRQASHEAETASKKNRNEQYVIKSLDGGLHYRVVTDVGELKPSEKVLAHYKEGNKIK